MMRKGNSLGKRIFSGILSLMMILTYSSMDVFAAGGTDGLAKITKDVAPLMTGFELTGEGVTVDEDGVYHVKANTAYNLKLAFEENKDLEMDMSDYIQFSMPDGSTAGDEKGQINIGVRDSLYSHDIDHNYVVDNDKLKITWNKDSKYFADLARAHDVNFNVNLSATFDGSKDEVKFGTENSVVVKVDNTGKVTVNKTVTGLKSGVTMTDAQKAAMTFELRDSTGAAIRTFTYADMEKNSISFDKIKPGQYSVVETGHPNFTNHSFDEADSVVVANGTLENGGVLTLSLKNDYEYDKGDLVLNKSIDCTNWDGSKTFPESMKDKIKFTITGPYDYSKTVSYADEGFKNGKYDLKGLNQCNHWRSARLRNWFRKCRPASGRMQNSGQRDIFRLYGRCHRTLSGRGDMPQRRLRWRHSARRARFLHALSLRKRGAGWGISRDPAPRNE